MGYRAIKCPCGDAICKKWIVQGLAPEATMTKAQAHMVAELLNTHEAYPTAEVYYVKNQGDERGD